MAEAAKAGAATLSDPDGFISSCRWVAEAHLAEDPDELITALCEVYRVLASRGWVPPEKASVLLRLQDSAVDLALARLLGPSPG